MKKWRKLASLTIENIANHKNASIFDHAVKTPDYHEIIKFPTDLGKIKQQVRDNIITNVTELNKELLLMCTNAIMYNLEGSPTYNMALEMLDSVELYLGSLSPVMKMAEIPKKRSRSKSNQGS